MSCCWAPMRACGPSKNKGVRSLLFGDVARGGVGALAEEVLAHLLLEVLAGPRIGEIQAILVHQHLLVLEPPLPRLLRDAFPEALAELAGIGRKAEAPGFLLQ